MDEDVAFGIFFVVFLLFVFTLPLSITGCIAASATRKWSKEKARRYHSGIVLEEADHLVEDSDVEEDEPLDSEDEEYYNAKREQKRREREETLLDQQLTTRGKFFKEWKKCWSGPAGGREQLAKEKELKDTEERRKIAREAVREYLRLERKKARRSQSKKHEESGMELPSYGNAVGENKK
ncbi:hypothetical protein H2200_006507 [Cladophialophora chaetospira]|uniref:Uncharacterized protein n=1 Tax=Cladophialophora chaetospira TaxID=386627 RepID=A0AA38X8B8_9EURO|nr:hypothetical protein H2200_006507 [Cladophialophora chaetospira]